MLLPRDNSSSKPSSSFPPLLWILLARIQNQAGFFPSLRACIRHIACCTLPLSADLGIKVLSCLVVQPQTPIQFIRTNGGWLLLLVAQPSQSSRPSEVSLERQRPSYTRPPFFRCCLYYTRPPTHADTQKYFALPPAQMKRSDSGAAMQ